MWAVTGFSDSSTDGLPYSVIYSDFNSLQEAQAEAKQERFDQISDAPLQYIEWNVYSELQAIIDKLNAPYFKGTNAQTQDRGYSNPLNPIESVFKPSVEQVQDKLNEGYSPSAIANLITDRELHILPYTGSESNAIREENLIENGGIGMLLLAAAFLLRK